MFHAACDSIERQSQQTKRKSDSLGSQIKSSSISEPLATLGRDSEQTGLQTRIISLVSLLLDKKAAQKVL